VAHVSAHQVGGSHAGDSYTGALALVTFKDGSLWEDAGTWTFIADNVGSISTGTGVVNGPASFESSYFVVFGDGALWEHTILDNGTHNVNPTWLFIADGVN
jgi:hypothetical protein